MSNRPILDPVEATFRDLREAVYAADGRAAMTAIADDRRRVRARQWLAGSRLRPTVPTEPASPGRPDLHGLP